MSEELIEYTDETYEQLIEQFKFKNDLYGIILRVDNRTLNSVMYSLSDPSKPVAKLDDHDMDNYKSHRYGGIPGRFNLFLVRITENRPEPHRPSIGLQMEGCVEETRLAFKVAEELVIAEGFEASKAYRKVTHYPVSYTEKGASFFCGGDFNLMINHFEQSVARYANHEEQVVATRQKFLDRLAIRGLELAIPDATKRDKFKPDDVADFLNHYIGKFKIVNGCRESSDWCAACMCEVCGAEEISTSYEFLIRLNKIEDVTKETRYFGTIVDICYSCSKIVLLETNLFEDGQADYDTVFSHN